MVRREGRSHSGVSDRVPGLGLAVGVSAGLVLPVLVVCLCSLFSLSLLATVRGGTSFLCPKRQRNEAKKTLSKQGLISVHSVQLQYLGTRKVQCSPEQRMFEPLLLTNPDMNTLRHQCSRASTDYPRAQAPPSQLRARALEQPKLSSKPVPEPLTPAYVCPAHRASSRGHSGTAGQQSSSGHRTKWHTTH
jgi:hypothetical protein